MERKKKKGIISQTIIRIPIIESRSPFFSRPIFVGGFFFIQNINSEDSESHDCKPWDFCVHGQSRYLSGEAYGCYRLYQVVHKSGKNPLDVPGS